MSLVSDILGGLNVFYVHRTYSQFLHLHTEIFLL